ncbi:VOC family protein [Mycolicibacterium mageritense]|uniref:VOC family protein n=1 Tax=Mycolicibacterium mageritense TaxID=53462 RepID=UPI0011D5B7C3|nr:hypothetical protein [Mycolicibacterium mageritense]TXI62495.1 MAG: hypothetical protein E6Q55_12805 [Mycolicibacterium mageritense]
MIRLLVLHYPRPDLPVAKALFEAALDCTFQQERHLDESTHYWHADLPDGCAIELWPASAVRPCSRVQLAFTVTDLDAADERLTDAGFEVRRLAATALLLDPSGNHVALMGRSDVP